MTATEFVAYKKLLEQPEQLKKDLGEDIWHESQKRGEWYAWLEHALEEADRDMVDEYNEKIRIQNEKLLYQPWFKKKVP